METGLTLLAMIVALGFLAEVIGLGVLPGWFRKRRREMVRRQIALTDAIHGTLGAIVSPVVKKPLWGPWQIEIAVPFAESAIVGRVLAVAHEVLSGVEGMDPGSYRIVLAARHDPIQKERRACARWTGEPCAGGSLAAG